MNLREAIEFFKVLRAHAKLDKAAELKCVVPHKKWLYDM